MCKKYEKIGISAFLVSDYETAKNCFSLAYNENPQLELLFFIELCEFGRYEDGEAQISYEYYKKNKHRQGLDPVAFIGFLEGRYENIISQKNEFDNENNAEEANAILYKEFNDIVKNKDFKQIMENVMFSTDMSFLNQNETLSFLDDLVDNGFLDMGLNYIEYSADLYIGNERFAKIVEKIKKNENSNKQ